MDFLQFKTTSLQVPFIALMLLLVVVVQNVHAYMVGDDPYHRVETLDTESRYQVEWKVHWNQKRIIFNVTAETRGYVGFGLSSKGKMVGADIVIGGVMANGRVYFSDRHAIGQQMPEKDASQDWTLHEAWEDNTHTFLSFSRAFDTCDPHDYPITEDKISILWAYGEHDNEVIGYHSHNRGEYPVYLLHGDYSPENVNDPHVGSGRPNDNNSLKIWTMNTRMQIPSDDTTYWCTVHKGPTLTRKHHAVGFAARFNDQQSRRHVHHLVLHKCRSPEGQNASKIFAPFLQHRGQLCYTMDTQLGPIPTEYCTEFYLVWDIGGRPFFYPPHVGFPLGEDKDEYYLLQVHYDNPLRLKNVAVDLSIDYYYTNQLRPHDGSILVVRHVAPGVTPSLLVPPHTGEHHAYGLCGRQCSREFLSREGIRIYGMVMHSHYTGVGMRFHHFRGSKELPWLMSDENYASDYQQTRILHGEKKVIRGDLLGIRCTYDNTRMNGTTTVGGFSTQHEMCSAFLYYYNRMSHVSECSSEINSEGMRKTFLGVGNVTWSNRELEFIVSEPKELAGLKISQVSDNHVHWDNVSKSAYQRSILEEPHVNACIQERHSLPHSSGYVMSPQVWRLEDTEQRLVTYPYEAKPYHPQKSCSFQ